MEKKKAVLHIKREADFHYDEAIKALRTNIQFCGSNVRMIMITSTVPEEGKSNISLEIAVSLAQIGKKVLLIEIFADPHLHRNIMWIRWCRDCHSISAGSASWKR